MNRTLNIDGEPFLYFCVDREFGPFFLKFCTYFPYNAKLCLNGHEYAKQQLAKKGIGFKALDNGVLECDDPKRLQAICDGLSAEKIDALLRKWLRLLPHPFSAAARKAGYRYQVSILQAEFSFTQVLDRPVTGRVFFEEVIRENLDIGRPGQVQLIFDRRVTARTPGRFRTRVITDGVVPSLHVDYKNTRIKQYHKEGRALRTETTINNTRDFGIGKLLKNLPALRQVGFQANRRLLDVQRVSHDCAIGEDAMFGAKRANGCLTRWFVPPRSKDREPQPSASVTSAYRRSLPYWLYSVSSCEGSTTAKCVCSWHNCWVSTLPNIPSEG